MFKEKLFQMLLVFFLVISTSFTVYFAFNQKQFNVGIVDLTILMQETPTGKNELQRIQNLLQEKREELGKKGQVLKQEEENLQRQAPMMSEKIRQNKMQEFQQKVMQYQEEMRMAEIFLKQEEDSVKQKVMNDLKNELKIIQKKRNIQLIYEKNLAPLQANALDITSDLINAVKK